MWRVTLLVRTGSRSYYGKMDVYFFNDTDYDTTDTYELGADVMLSWYNSTNAAVHLEAYANGAWRDMYDLSANGQMGNTAQTNRPYVVPLICSRTAGGNIGAVRVSAPSANNSILTGVVLYTTKTAG